MIDIQTIIYQDNFNQYNKIIQTIFLLKNNKLSSQTTHKKFTLSGVQSLYNKLELIVKKFFILVATYCAVSFI